MCMKHRKKEWQTCVILSIIFLFIFGICCLYTYFIANKKAPQNVKESEKRSQSSEYLYEKKQNILQMKMVQNVFENKCNETVFYTSLGTGYYNSAGFRYTKDEILQLNNKYYKNVIPYEMEENVLQTDGANIKATYFTQELIEAEDLYSIWDLEKMTCDWETWKTQNHEMVNSALDYTKKNKSDADEKDVKIKLYFLLAAKDAYLEVYTYPEKIKCFSTGICLDSLPKNIVERIENGCYILQEESLYDFLESYSS